MTISVSTEDFLSFEDIEEQTIVSYFETVNSEKFDRTAELFAESGELLAPFEKPIIGRSAIASYLEKEAKGMKLLPKTGTISETSSNQQQIDLTGKVQTSLFMVNVGWYFTLNREAKILKARIKLLASPQELLGLKQFQDR